jgi:hypothetical protein
MNKKMNLFLLSLILLALFIPMASAASTFNALEETLADVALVFAGDAALNGIAREDMFWATLAVFAIVMSAFSAAAFRLSIFQNRKGATTFIGMMLGITAIRTPGTISLFWGIGGIALMVVLVAMVFFLIISVWKSSSNSSKQLSADSLAADKDLSERRKDLRDVQVDEKKSIQDEKIELNALKGESKALKAAEKLAKKSFKFEADLIKKLKQMKELLKEVESAGARDSPAATAARQRVLNLIRVEIPTIQKEGGLFKELKQLSKTIKRYQYSEFAAYDTEVKLRNEITRMVARHPGLAATTPGQINTLAKEVHTLQEIERKISAQITVLEGEVESESVKFNGLIQGIIDSLESGSISECLGHIQQALGLAADEESKLLKIRTSMGDLSKTQATMFSMVQKTMKLSERYVDNLFRAR